MSLAPLPTLRRRSTEQGFPSFTAYVRALKQSWARGEVPDKTTPATSDRPGRPTRERQPMSPTDSKRDNQLANYVQVNERIQKFYEQYPDGRLTDDLAPRPHGDTDKTRWPSLPRAWEVKELDGHTFIVYYAVAYRTPEDALPGRGVAWEPFPGPTPFTRDSELMNAQTSSWGRALAAVGIEVQKSIATAEDVKAREQKSNNKSEGESPLPKEAADRLAEIIQKAGRDEHLPAKLRSFGVKELTDLTIDQSKVVHRWALEGEAKKLVET